MQGQAIIVGGGISGLAVARGLCAAGWSVQVFERAAGLPEQGTALGMWPAAMRALDLLGVGDDVRARGVRASGGALLRASGSRIAPIKVPGETYLVPRPVLHDILFDPGASEVVSWNATIDNVASLPRADVIIGADGIHSIVRDHVLGQRITPRPLDCIALRGTIAGAPTAMSETWGDGRLFGISEHDAQHTYWFAAVRTDLVDASSATDDWSLVQEFYAGWHPQVQSVLERIEPGSIDRRTLYDLPRLPTTQRDNAVIVGDAAHAMAPNAGRGACESLVDAAALVAALSASDSVAEALAQFDKNRRRAGQRVVLISRVLSRVALRRRGGIRDRIDRLRTAK